jgi:3-methyladenine DNA glycosylase/8-oxoguanine DNA glycosylase
MYKVTIDRLMDMCTKHADKIAVLWYKSLSTNPRTVTCREMPEEGALRHAVKIYQSMGEMFFADNCFQAVSRVLNVDGFAEDFYARGIPLEEVLYALILLRRHIWLYADVQVIFSTETDLYFATESINRILLVFDYATYIVAHKYREFARKTAVC